MKMRLLAGFLCAVSAFAADAPAMTNYGVWMMYKQGATAEQMISAIRGSAPGYNLSAAEVAKLANNGVPQSVIDAMSARQLAPKNQLMATPREVRAPRERPAHWGMTPGMPEATIGGGLDTSFPDVSTPNGAFLMEGAVGINRYLATVGSINRFGQGVGGTFSGGAHITESLFGIRASASNSSRVTPFVTGLFGVGRQTVDALGFSASKNTPAVGVGVGVEVNATRNIGFRFEPRVTYGIDYDFRLHANFGVFFRYGR